MDYWKALVQKLRQNIERNEPSIYATGNYTGAVKPYHILFKYPIRYRRDKFFATLDLYYASLKTDDFTFLITIDGDDKEMNNKTVFAKLKKYRNLKWEIAGCTNKIQAVNYGIEREEWDIVVIVSDDMIPKVRHLDEVIRKRMAQSFPDTDGALWFNDGFQKDRINTLQIMGRKWFDRWGFVYHEDYVSQRCDFEYQNLCKRFNRIKYFPEVIIRHEHADFGLAPYDKLLLHNYTYIKRDEEVYNHREKIGFPVGIPKIAHFIWSKGTPLTYFRYLTYQTWKKHNPEWKMMFHLVEGCGTVKNWSGREELEFMNKKGKDYLPNVAQNEIITENVKGILPNFASDLIRWKSLYEFGGFYLDLDQLILKPFDPFTDYDIVWGGTKINYSGVMGMFRRCPVAKEMYDRTREKIEAGTENYCDAGNWLWDTYVANQTDFRYYKTLRAKMEFFYPVEQSFMMKQFYEGAVPDLTDAYALHWFGGHPDSQTFNRKSENEINKTLKLWKI